MADTVINIKRSAASEARKAQQELIPQLLLQMQQQGRDRAQQQLLARRDEREQSRFLMEQANVKYNRDQAEKIVNSNNALNKWANAGWDNLYANLDNPNLNMSYSAKIPDINTSFGGYQQTMTGLNLEANRATFNQGYGNVAKDYITRLVNKQNAHIQTLINENPNADINSINRNFGNKYSADNVYNQAMNVMGQEWVEANMLYQPAMRKKTFNETFNPLNFIRKPEIRDAQGNVLQQSQLDPTKTLSIGGMTAGAGGLGYTGKKIYDNMKTNTASYLDDVKKDWKSLSADKFKKKYDMTKTQAGGKWSKKGTFKSSQQILNNARQSSMNKSMARHGAKALPYAMAYQGMSQLEKFLPESMQNNAAVEGAKIIATPVAGKLTTKGVMAAVKSPAFRKALIKIGGNRAKAALAGLGVSQAGLYAPEGLSTLAGAVGTGVSLWTLKGVIQDSAELMKYFQE